MNSSQAPTLRIEYVERSALFLFHHRLHPQVAAIVQEKPTECRLDVRNAGHIHFPALVGTHFMPATAESFSAEVTGTG